MSTTAGVTLCSALESYVSVSQQTGPAIANDCGTDFCRSSGGKNYCFAQNDLCPYQSTAITYSTVKGPADANLVCPQTTKCVGGTTDNGYTGNFCV
ncbi:unnamed protein product, partial [Mesorhabditis spiculigera]